METYDFFSFDFSLNFCCPTCGKHVDDDLIRLYDKITCPSCKTSYRLQLVKLEKEE